MIQHDSKYSWFRLSITLAIATIGNVGMWLIIVVMPAIQSEFHIDRADAALPYTLTMIGFAFGNFIIGGFVDRYGIVRVLIAAAVRYRLDRCARRFGRNLAAFWCVCRKNR